MFSQDNSFLGAGAPGVTMASRKRGWWVYMLRCADGTLYCGSTPDMGARLAAHNEGRGAKYTRGKLPVRIAFQRRLPDRSAAMREEARIKCLARRDKLDLISKAR